MWLDHRLVAALTGVADDLHGLSPHRAPNALQVGDEDESVGVSTRLVRPSHLLPTANRPFADPRGEPDQIPPRILYKELMHAGLHLARAIPLLLRFHEERPVSLTERYQDGSISGTLTWKFTPRPNGVSRDAVTQSRALTISPSMI